jgi:hypothetical protein
MRQTAEDLFDRANIELLLAENKFVEALALLCQSAKQTPLDREMSLYVLFLRVRLHGPEYYEGDIDALRALSDFNDHEKALVRRIFLYAFQVAEKAGQEEKKRAYQRLLRRLLLGQPLTQPIPITPKPLPLGPRVILLEEAAIVSTPVAITGQAAAKVPSGMDMMRSLVVGYCAALLLAAPMAYLVSRNLPAGNRPAAALARSARTPATARVNMGNDGMSAQEGKQVLYRFDEEQIKNGLARQLTGLRRAYARWTAKRPNMTGKVSLKLTLDGRGKVVAVEEVSSQLPEPGFIETVIAEVRKWQLPIAQAEASEITIPLLFISQGTDSPRIAGWQQRSSRKPGRSVENTEPISLAAAKVEAGGAQGAIAASQYDLAGQAGLDYMARQMIALREEPRFASQAIEQIDGGTRVAVVAVVGDWFKVRTAHSRVAGFVRKEFIVPVAFAR